MSTAIPAFTPHSIEDQDYWSAQIRQPHISPIVEKITVSAQEADPNPAAPLATDFLAARRSNDRSILDRWWHKRSELGALAARRLTLGLDPSDSDDLLLNTLWVQATQATWVVSAHLPEKDLPVTPEITVDLASAEMAADLAECCETLGPWMDSVSGTLKQRVLNEVDRRVLTPFSEGAPLHWEDGGSNWTGVCAGSILAACQSFAAMGLPRPKAKKRALLALERYLQKAFTPSGECEEGLGYWGFGLEFAMLGWMRLPPEEFQESVDTERLRQVASYPRRAHLFGDSFFTGNDGGMRNRCSAWLAQELAQRTGEQWLLDWAAQYPTESSNGYFSQHLRRLSTSGQVSPDASQEHVSRSLYLPDQQTAIVRHNGSSGELIGILTGGHNAELHNHNDIGHFLIGLGEKFIVPDLGNRFYTADFFTAARYTYLAASSRGHNCLLVNGHEQRAGRAAQAVLLQWDEAQELLSIDGKAAYPEEAGLAQWVRTLRPMEDAAGTAMSITDVVSLNSAPGTVVSRIWSTVPIETVAPEQFTLGPVVLTVSPVPVAWDVISVQGTDEGLRSFMGETLYALDLHYPVTSAALELSLVFRPVK